MPWVIGFSFKFMSEVTSVSLRLNQTHLTYILDRFRAARIKQENALQDSKEIKLFVIPYLADELSVEFT